MHLVRTALLTAFMLLTPLAVADPVTVSGDASGSPLAVSVFGDAHSDCVSGGTSTACVGAAVSVFGDSSVSCSVTWNVCVLGSLAGGRASTFCDTDRADSCVLLSFGALGGGDAWCRTDFWAEECVALAAGVGGNSSARCEGDAFWEATHCVLVSASVLEDADSRCPGATSFGQTCAALAVAGGNATSSCGSAGAGNDDCVGIAIALLGDATAECYNDFWTDRCTSQAVSILG